MIIDTGKKSVIYNIIIHNILQLYVRLLYTLFTQ